MCLSQWCEKSRGTHLLSLLEVGFQFDAKRSAHLRSHILSLHVCECAWACPLAAAPALGKPSHCCTSANVEQLVRLAWLLKKRICPSATGDWRLHCLPLLRKWSSWGESALRPAPFSHQEEQEGLFVHCNVLRWNTAGWRLLTVLVLSDWLSLVSITLHLCLCHKLKDDN